MARPAPSRGPSRGQLPVGRYFGALALMLAVLYAIVFFAGTGSSLLTPRLGLDLQGGASVVLTPRTDDGAPPRADQLATAVQIIQQRVNGLGVAEAEVVTQGDNIVVSVPGGTRDSLRSLAQTAQLRFREVLDTAAGDPNAPPPPAPSAAPVPSGSAAPAPAPVASTSVVVPVPSGAATPRGRALPEGLTTQASPAPAPAASRPAAVAPSPSATATAGPAFKSGDVYTPETFARLDCSDDAARGGGSTDKPEQQIVACSDDGAVKYHLDAAKVVGTDVKGASASLDQNTGTQWQIVVEFTGAGQDKFTNLTEATVGKNVAIVLDGIVLSAPTIQTRIDSDAQITGDFTQKTSAELANTLKYGALPLSFENSQVEVVSATLGEDQLHAGLLAGGLGMIAVLIYSLLYYRALGTVVIASLVVASLLTYGAVAVLGDVIGFALSLAGVAGLIVAIGITADSFVVYFERLKDEIQEGRTPRAAVDRGWVRARRTIISADVVSFLAAIILYFVSVGGVRGFAFTLGLTTVIDVAVVFLFTRPLVSYLSRYRWFSSRRWTGFVGPGGSDPLLTAPRTGAAAPSRRPLTTEA